MQVNSQTGYMYGVSNDELTQDTSGLPPESLMPAGTRALAAPPPRVGSENTPPGSAGTTGGPQRPPATPPTFQGQNVFTRYTPNGYSVSAKGGSWLTLSPDLVAQTITNRFGMLGNNVLAIEGKLQAHQELTADEIVALRRFAVATEYLARVDPALKSMLDTPSTHTQDEVQISYVGGPIIRTDYTQAEVLEMTSEALKNPLASFVKSSQDLGKKLARGEALTPEEASTIERYTGVADQFMALTPAGWAMKVAGMLTGGLNQVLEGKPLTRALAHELLDELNVRPNLGAVQSARNETPPATPSTPFVKRPVHLQDGRIGYLLGPTKPPRMRPEQPGTSGVSTAGGGSTTRPPARQLGQRDVEKLAGKGPLKLRAPTDQAAEQQRMNSLRVRFEYYRHDRDVSDMAAPMDATEARYDQRRDVLNVGETKDATSYDSKMKMFTGTYWDKKGISLKKTDQIISIDNGREGVGAIAVPYSKIPRGGTVLVTTGTLSGCSVVMASDGRNFYAYHAGTNRAGPGWTTSADGAAEIVRAHNAMRPDSPVVASASPGGQDLMNVGNKYPFSVIVYNGKSGSLTNPSTGNSAERMSMFDYFEPDNSKSVVGTGEAVISKDMNGTVSVRVLAEKGTLSDPKSGPDGMTTKYTMQMRKTSVYTLPAATS
ncbi:cytotoxic necrotizing factor Rho-activating domain-containing protein [Caballeronia sp. GAWG2-1]|uniref:cytotoxic necrotizing factor Rho-activating domain-containing protein n=1 Tax=Caballeronia sp. GAWG2-1 TaxID=2921744 RepID=UPI002028B5F4|nr:cytotoxic necrotizing factor Rho-activating domain-containing protein [Caballeronia sp. GAWG2-1]